MTYPPDPLLIPESRYQTLKALLAEPRWWQFGRRFWSWVNSKQTTYLGAMFIEIRGVWRRITP